jgi:hypothetical protein
MNWLASLSKSITARIEGRNSLVGLILAFSAFIIYIFVSSYDHHPGLSVLAMVVGVIGIALLRTPQPSEVSQKSILIKRDFFWAGGLQSREEVISVLKEAHHVRELPPPYAVVHGSATNPNDYRVLDPAEAAMLAQQDHEGVEKMLLDEAARLSTSMMGHLKEPADRSQQIGNSEKKNTQ